MLVELRATPASASGKNTGGSQTVFPPSTHPSGELVQWSEDADGTEAPLSVGCSDLRRVVVELAILCLMARHAVPGSVLLYLQGGVWPELPRRVRDGIDQWLGVARHSQGTGLYRPLRLRASAVLGAGNRNVGLFQAGCAKRARGASMAEVEAELEQENQARCVPPLSARELKSLCRSISRYAPGGART